MNQVRPINRIRDQQQPVTRRDRTRLALLDAGEQLMASRSVDAIAIDEIVEVAGVAKGTFYNHFPDKDTLQHDVLVRIRIDMRRTIAELNAGTEDPARRVARAFCQVLRYCIEHPQRGNFLIRTFMAFRLVEEEMNQGLVTEIAAGLKIGRFNISATESGALLMLGITQAALVHVLDHSEHFPLVARAQHMAAMLLRGLGLDHSESEKIAAQEADFVICNSLSAST